MKLKIDMHVHSEESFDSRLTLEKIAELSKIKGLDGVVICNHDKAFVTEKIIYGVHLYPGIEISTDKGHLLGLFINGEVEAATDFFEAANRIKAAGGLVFLAHPYQSRRKSKSKHDACINAVAKILDGIEVQNSRACSYVKKANSYAMDAANRHALLISAGSDGHTEKEIGASYVTLDAQGKSADEVKKALKDMKAEVCGESSKRVYTAKSQYIKLRKNGGSVKKYVKLALFSIKSAVYDMVKR